MDIRRVLKHKYRHSPAAREHHQRRRVLRGWKESLRRHRKPVLLGLAGLAVIVLSGVIAWVVFRPHPKIIVTHRAAPTPTPTPTPPLKKASPLTGVMVDPADADRTVLAVVIENQQDSRPQSGLAQAGIVYEANAEGGITRFLALYLESRPKVIGPVRSLRTYFVSWAREFDTAIAHAGGNADALDMTGPVGVVSVNALDYGAAYFYRVNDRFSPHNLYTGFDLLDKMLGDLHINHPATFVPSPRKADSPPNPNAPHPNIHIDYSYNGFQVDYKYDPNNNGYARFMAGAPHIDRETGQQIYVKNIVVEFMPTSYGYTRIGEETVIMQTVGHGRAIVFRDGEAIEGTWQKDSHAARTKLIDANGAEIKFDPGNTWYSIVPEGKSVTY